eukprot:s398_g21.t1
MAISRAGYRLPFFQSHSVLPDLCPEAALVLGGATLRAVPRLRLPAVPSGRMQGLQGPVLWPGLLAGELGRPPAKLPCTRQHPANEETA